MNELSGLTHQDAARLYPVHVQAVIDRHIQERGFEAVLNVSGDLLYPAIDSDALRIALANFPLQLLKDWDWLAVRVREALTVVTPNLSYMDNGYKGNIATRDQLLRLAHKCGDLYTELHGIDGEVERVIAASFRNEGLATIKETLARLEFLRDSLEITARHLKQPVGKSVAAAGAEIRIRQARYLAPVFENAFGSQATLNDWPGAALGPWADFFNGIAKLATQSPVANLRKVLKEARKRSRKAPIFWADMTNQFTDPF